MPAAVPIGDYRDGGLGSGIQYVNGAAYFAIVFWMPLLVRLGTLLVTSMT